MLWNPPESPLTIEFPPDLLTQAVRLGGLQGTRGILYGHQNGKRVEVLSARRKRDGRPPGLERVGVFAVRSRGHVFMTEGDLKWFGEHEALVGLVAAGDRAGFFVRGFDRMLQSIRSYQEITIPRARAKKQRPRFAIPAAVLGICAALLVSVFAARLITEPPVNLAVTQREGQLLITWNRAARAAGGRIEIKDGGIHKIFTVLPEQWSATYTPASRDVEIRLSPPTRLLFGKAELVWFAAGERSP
jgi:hypothetical protein